MQYVLLPHLKELREEEEERTDKEVQTRYMTKEWYRLQQAIYEKKHNTIH